MVANGFKVYFLDDYRSTPELSFLVRYKKCACGIMVTASHNPPSDNAVKVYWSTGGQVVPPHDKAIIERVMNVAEIKTRRFPASGRRRQDRLLQGRSRRGLHQSVASQAFPGPRDLKIIYSPLHGVGESAVCPGARGRRLHGRRSLRPASRAGRRFSECAGPRLEPREPSRLRRDHRARPKSAGRHRSSPPIPTATAWAAPPRVTKDRNGAWGTFTGNQLGALLADYVCEQRKKAGTPRPKTLPGQDARHHAR